MDVPEKRSGTYRLIFQPSDPSRCARRLRAVSCSGNTGLPGGLSEWEPPDPIPNSEVKLLCADDSVGSPHVKVGHRQAPNVKTPRRFDVPGFFFGS